MAYFLATRPIMAGFGFLLTLVGFRIQPHLNIPFLYDYLCALTVSAMICATMVTNDYVDRHHDVKKGKYFAREHEVTFLRYCFVWWLIVVVLIVVVSNRSISAGLYATALAAVSAGYHLTYRTRGLALITVALTSTGTVWFPLFLPGSALVPALKGAWIIFCLNLAREQCKDEEDRKIDLGYKRTLAGVNDKPYPGLWGAARRFCTPFGLYCAAYPLGGYCFGPTPLTVVAIILIVTTGFFPRHYRQLLDPAMVLVLISGLTNFSI